MYDDKFKEENLSKFDPFSEDYDPSLGEMGVLVKQMCEVCNIVMCGPIWDTVKRLSGDRELVCLILHGSYLYGTDHPESDIDVKGVFMPTRREIILGQIPRTITYSSGDPDGKNSKEDVDIELHPVGHFLKLLKEGDSGAISMMNAPHEKTCFSTVIWDDIIANPSLFYSKKMFGLMGFVQSQTTKYCKKGDRLRDVKKVLTFLEAQDPESKMREHWDKLPTGDYIDKVVRNGDMYYQVCDKLTQNTVKVKMALATMNAKVRSYGNRAILAEENNSLDWKAISHAFRVAQELSNLYEFGKINYPLKDCDRIRQIKLGELDFKTEVLPELNSLMGAVDKMSSQSSFPDVLDNEKIDDLLFYIINKYTLNSMEE